MFAGGGKDTMRKRVSFAAGVTVIVAVAVAVLLCLRFLGSEQGTTAGEMGVSFDVDPDISGNTASSIGPGGVEDCLRVDVAPGSFGDGVADVTIDIVVQGDTLAPVAYDAWLIYEPTKVDPVSWDDRIKLPGAAPMTTKKPPQLNAGALYMSGGPGTAGDGTLVRIDLDVISAGVTALSLHEPPGSAYVSEAGSHPSSTGAGLLAINEDCPPGRQGAEGGATPEPAGGEEITPTPDVRAELERLRLEEAAKPRFEGAVNGIRLYPTGAAAAVQRKWACSGAGGEGVEHVPMSVVAGTPMEIAPTYLPPGAEENPPTWSPVICKGTVAYVERQWVIRDKDANFFIVRRQGEQAIDIDASADRVSSATVGGKRAALVKPLTPEGYGYSMVIVAEEFGLTSVVAFGLPLEETVKIAEGLK